MLNAAPALAPVAAPVAGVVLAAGLLDSPVGVAFTTGLLALIGTTLTLLFDRTRRQPTPTEPTPPAVIDPEDETAERLWATLEARAAAAEARVEDVEMKWAMCREANAELAGIVGSLRERLIRCGQDPDAHPAPRPRPRARHHEQETA